MGVSDNAEINFNDRDNGGNSNGVFYNLKVEKIIRKLESDKDEPDKLLITNVILGESFELSVVGLSDDRELPKLLASKHVPVIRKERSNVQSYLITRYNELLKQKQIEYRHSQLGWFKYEDSDLFLLQNNELNGVISNCDRKCFEFQRGEVETYLTFLDEIVYTNHNLALAVTIGLSAVVVSRLKNAIDIGTIICNFSGRSTTGKTTAAKLIASLFAAPTKNGLLFRFNATKNALAARLMGINGLPMIIDDILVNEKIDMSELIYALADGSNKDRCTANSQLRNDSNDSFNGVIVLTSEYPVLDVSNKNKGLLVRILSMNDIEWTPDAETAIKIQQTVSENYGLIGVLFAKLVSAIPLNTLYEYYLEVKQKLHNLMPNCGSFTDRLEKQYVVIYLTVLLVNKCFNKKLNADKLIKIALKSQQMTIEENDNAATALEVVKSFIIRYQKNFIIHNYDKDPTSFSGEYYGEICVHSPYNKEAYILPELVDTIIENKKIRDKRGIKREWRDKGIIKTEKGRFTDKYSKSFIESKRYIHFMFNDSESKIANEQVDINHTGTNNPTIDTTQWDEGDTLESVFEGIDD